MTDRNEKKENDNSEKKENEVQNIPPQKSEARLIWKTGMEEFITGSHKIQMFGKDINSLYGENWLNDKVVKWNMWMLAEKFKNRNVHLFSALTYLSFKFHRKEGLRRQLRKVSLL